MLTKKANTNIFFLAEITVFVKNNYYHLTKEHANEVEKKQSLTLSQTH